MILFLRGGGYEKHRRCKLLFSRIDITYPLTVILCLLPLTIFGALNRIEQEKICRAMEIEDVSTVIKKLDQYSAKLNPGVPYDVSFTSVKGLIVFYNNVSEDSVHLDHLLNIAKFWWLRRNSCETGVDLTKKDLSTMKLTNLQELLVIQVKLDNKGDFSDFLLEKGYIKREVLELIKSGNIKL